MPIGINFAALYMKRGVIVEIGINMYNYMHNDMHSFAWDAEKHIENIKKHGISFF